MIDTVLCPFQHFGFLWHEELRREKGREELSPEITKITISAFIR